MSKSQKIHKNTHTKDKQQERKNIKEKKNLPAKSEKRKEKKMLKKPKRKTTNGNFWQLDNLFFYIISPECSFISSVNIWNWTFSLCTIERPKRIICFFFMLLYPLLSCCYKYITTTKRTHFSVWCLTFWHSTKIWIQKKHKFMQS